MAGAKRRRCAPSRSSPTRPACVSSSLAEGQRWPIVSPLIGVHNVANILAAAAAARALGLTWDAVQAGAAACAARAGSFRARRPPAPALSRWCSWILRTPRRRWTNALRVARGLCRGTLAVVLGCGGDRDRGKRPLMGAAAARLADRVYVTSDNPRSEDPAAILAEIVAGARASGGTAALQVIEDRRSAIRAAIRESGAGRSGAHRRQGPRGHPGRRRDVPAVLRPRGSAPRARGGPMPGMTQSATASRFGVAELLAATGGALRTGPSGEREAAGVSTDSRTLVPGELFVALSGPREQPVRVVADGHRFLGDALRRGAWGVLVEEQALQRGEVARELESWPGRAVLVVPDSLRALGDLAAYHRRRMPARIVGITGSNGKTTTKEMLASILLQKRGPVLKNEGNLNNHIGPCRSRSSS